MSFNQTDGLCAFVCRYSVNLPRVTAQLEKLMGTNVVRLTDRKYMQELQRRIQEDYNVTLEKRITEREVSEAYGLTESLRSGFCNQ